MKEREGLYTAKQVCEILNLSASQITRLVERDILETVQEPGYKHKYYTRQSVNAYKAERESFESRYEEK